MKIRKPLFIIFGVFLLTLMLGVGASLYYYTHPPKVKALVEKAVSRTTGASISIQHLSYSLNPIKIHAKGITFQPAGEENGFSAQIQDVMADCVLDGSFGRKTLIFRTLKVNGFECRVRKGATAVTKDPGSEERPSFLNSVAGLFASFFLFKDFRLEAAEMGEGHVIVRWGGRRIEVSGLSGRLNADHLMDFRGGITVESPSGHTILSIPDLHIETTSAMSLADPQIDFTLAFSDLNLTLEGVEGKSGDLNISGPMDFSGTFSGETKQGQWLFDCNVQGNMKNNPVSYRAKTINIKGLMTAQVTVQGPVSNLKLSGKLTGNQVAFKGKGVSMKSATGTLNFSGTYPNFDIKKLSCRIPEIKHLTEKKVFSVEHVQIGSTQGRVNLLKRSLNFPEIRINSSLLSNILAAFQLDNGRLTLTAKGKETGLTHAASRLKLLPSDWTFQGMDTIAVTATVGKKGAITFSTDLALKKFGFQNPQETCLGENISFQAHISGRITPVPSTIRATAELSADGGEVLMDRFYFDLGENAFFAKYNGSYQGLNKRLKLDNLSLGMNKIVTAHVTGTLFQAGDEYEGELSLGIPDTPLKAPFHRLIREPFQMEEPALSTVRLEGIVGAEATLKGKRSHW
ncbi:MAG: hypothetical protein J7M20_06175, partial [Deltaproteobacteria bacterium]|nr:hypothetical protein [Deltaproteobacteria bacterium]